MNYADIKTIDIQDGTGVRVSIYVSGCHFHCEGCHNQEAWDFNYGKKFTDETINYILKLMEPSYIAGLSLLGGEPMELVNQEGLAKLVEKVKAKFPEKTIWCYTGYQFDEVLENMYPKYSFTKTLLENIDIIVDGEFIQTKNMVDLKFRGSTNQRKIDVKATLAKGEIIQLKFGDEDRYEEVKEGKPMIMFEAKFHDEKQAQEEIPSVADNVVEFVINNDESQEDEGLEQITMPGFDIVESEEQVAAKSIIKKDKNKA